MKRKIMVIIMILASFLFVGKVYAEEENTCSATLLSELRSEAANVKVTYVTGDEVIKTEPDPEIGITSLKKHYVYIKIFNINSKMSVRIAPTGAGVSGSEIVVGANDVDTDGVVTLKQEALDANVTYVVDVLSVYGGCSGTTLRSMKLTVPKFNIYSELDICSDVPDYYLCLQYTNYNIDSATVYDKINEYKSKLAEENIDEINKNEANNSISKAMSGISKYKYLIVGAIVAIGVIITVIIVKRKKSVL